MAGNTRFELTEASPSSSLVGNYQNAQRGYSTPTMERSASFRDSAESRSFGSGKANSRGSTTSLSDMHVVSQYLLLDPIALGDQKYARPGDLRRVLSFSIGNGSADNSFDTAHPKNQPLGGLEELKRLRASVSDTCVKASCRAKKLDEHLNKLNKCIEVVSSKKQLRNELLTNERSSGSTLKIGSQMHRNTPELGTHKFDDRPKNVSLNKRLRTSVAETRAESQNNGVLRQPLLVTRERELLKDNNADSDMAEEKIRRLPVGGEGWDKKMKRKRSVGAVVTRTIDSDGELRRTMHHKLTSDSSMQPSDSSNNFRSGASGGSNKLDPTSSPAGSSARIPLKNEQEKSVLSRDFSAGPVKERALGKANVKLNSREDSDSICPSPIVKGKASRGQRVGSMIMANSAINVPRASTLESWEQPQAVNRTASVAGANNRKRTVPAGPSSPPITQWGGHRPQKISRTRRANLNPISTHEEVQIQSEGCSPSDFGPRLSTGGTTVSLFPKNAANGNQNFKGKLEIGPSPSRFSETEESGAGKNRIKEKDVGCEEVEEKAGNAGQNIGPSAINVKKDKFMAKEENGDGVRRQGRSGRRSPFSRSSISPTREKLDDLAPTKPLRNARSGTDKNGSKSGRPLKKLSDRKGFSRLGIMTNGGSPDCNGESEDDREELLAAANLACSSAVSACSSAFWKTVEALFTSIGVDEKLFLSEQRKLAEESCAISFKNCSLDEHVQDDHGCEELAESDSIFSRTNRCMKNETGSKHSQIQMEFVEQHQNSSILGCSDPEKRYDIVTPIYQRVLSALILDDEIDDFEESGFGKPITLVNDSCPQFSTESKHMDLDYGEPVYGVQPQNNGNAYKISSCNGNTNFYGRPGSQESLCNGELLHRDGGYMHSEVEVLVRLSRCDYIPERLQTDSCIISSFECQYEQMHPEEKLVVELKSLDLFLETVPALDDKEDQIISQEIALLKMGLHEQTGKKKKYLDKIYGTIQEGKLMERRNPEQIAMDKLVELAYKKFLATRGSFASKQGIAKVSKQVALSFARRTLARCRKFEDSGASCFSEPMLRDIVHAPPPRFEETELLTGANLAIDGNSNRASAKTVPVSNRGKKREVHLDDVGGAVFKASSALGILNGAKGKRSERDASIRNAGAKGGRSSMGGSKGERKTKSKPKQKTAQLSTSGNGFINSLSDTKSSAYPSASGSGDSANNSYNRKRDVRFRSSDNAPPEMKESTDFAQLGLNEVDGLDELGVDSEIGASQDINSWFNFEVDALHDTDSIGLEIPMDDLSQLDFI